MREGWKCPVCGRGVSPDFRTCEHGYAATPVNPLSPVNPLCPLIPVYVPPPVYSPAIPWWSNPTTCGGTSINTSSSELRVH